MIWVEGWLVSEGFTSCSVRPRGASCATSPVTGTLPCGKPDIPDFRWHDTRHTAASRLVMAGVDLFTVKEILGHKTLAMTARYSHLSPGHQRQALERLADRQATPTGANAAGQVALLVAPGK